MLSFLGLGMIVGGVLISLTVLGQMSVGIVLSSSGLALCAIGVALYCAFSCMPLKPLFDDFLLQIEMLYHRQDQEESVDI